MRKAASKSCLCEFVRKVTHFYCGSKLRRRALRAVNGRLNRSDTIRGIERGHPRNTLPFRGTSKLARHRDRGHDRHSTATMGRPSSVGLNLRSAYRQGAARLLRSVPATEPERSRPSPEGPERGGLPHRRLAGTLRCHNSAQWRLCPLAYPLRDLAAPAGDRPAGTWQPVELARFSVGTLASTASNLRRVTRFALDVKYSSVIRADIFRPPQT
jgi:hypothetical protein